MSSDCVPVLISLGAQIRLVGPEGSRDVDMAGYYVADGTRHTKREDAEVTTELRIPVPKSPTRARYTKWTVRGSIDFPLVSVALRFDLDGDSAQAKVTDLRVVVGVLGAKPRVLTRLDEVLGKSLSDPEVAKLVSERAHVQAKPLENVPYEAPYRRRMIQVHTRRAIEAIVSAG
jgi:CO/xanthine dehydrogenase FAD-binding subunit